MQLGTILKMNFLLDPINRRSRFQRGSVQTCQAFEGIVLNQCRPKLYWIYAEKHSVKPGRSVSLPRKANKKCPKNAPLWLKTENPANGLPSGAATHPVVPDIVWMAGQSPDDLNPAISLGF